MHTRTTIGRERWCRGSRILTLLGLVGLAAAAGVVPAQASSKVPFSATLSGSSPGQLCNGGQAVCITITRRGVATHMGSVSYVGTATVDITQTVGSCSIRGEQGVLNPDTDGGTLTAANGATITLHGGGTSCKTADWITHQGTLTITHGTGRFAGVKGTLREEVFKVNATETEQAVLTGKISSPGRKGKRAGRRPNP